MSGGPLLQRRTNQQSSSATPTRGAVITEAGNHPRVAGLAYIAAFAPDKGESVATLNPHKSLNTEDQEPRVSVCAGWHCDK